MSLKVVSNAGPLIHLSRIGALWLLKELFGIVYIPKRVYEEAVIIGIKKGYRDAYVIKRSIDEGWIKVENVKEIEEISGLHEGEIEAINLALKMNAILLSDDSSAREFGRIMGLKVHGSFWVIIESYRRGIIKYEKAEGLILKLASTMYASSEVLSAALKILKEVQYESKNSRYFKS